MTSNLLLMLNSDFISSTINKIEVDKVRGIYYSRIKIRNLLLNDEKLDKIDIVNKEDVRYERRLLNTDFICLSRLGEGTTAEVFRCYKDGKYYAIKRMSVRKDWLSETNILKEIGSDCDPYFICWDYSFVNKGFYYIVTEIVENSMTLKEAILDERELLSYDDKIKIFKTLILAVKKLHSLGIVHRDLKPTNVLISFTDDLKLDKIKIIDFGYSTNLNTKYPRGYMDIIFRIKGSPYYMSPEYITKRLKPLERNLKLLYAVDLWALGVTMYWCLTKEYFYYNLIEKKVIEMGNNSGLRKGSIHEMAYYYRQYFFKLKLSLETPFEFINPLLRTNPKNRNINEVETLINI